MSKKLTKEQNQMRNFNIMRLRGFVPRFKSLIPPEIREDLSYYDQLDDMQNELIALLNKIKKKKYACKNCCDYKNLKMTYAKEAIYCDYCHKFTGELYILKDKK